MPEMVCPGDRLGSTAEYIAGKGTYEHNGFVHAALVGKMQAGASKADGKATLEVVSSGSQSVLPEPGSEVTVKVMKVASNAAHAVILCVGDQPLDLRYTGVIRQQDVRATEIDKVVMYDCFRPGDVVKAQVLSLGDARSFYLTTAKNELGVVYAKSLAGAAMTPISWQEMQCPDTMVVEKRKVAKVVAGAS